MKVLYVIDGLGSGGKERRLVELIKGLHMQMEVELVLLKPDIHYQEIESLNVRIHWWKRNLKQDHNILRKFIKLVNSFQPDIVHSWDNIASFHFGPICKVKGIPFINSMITTAFSLDTLKYCSKRFAATVISYPFSDVILSNSRAGLITFRAPANKSKVIYNGFDMERLNVKRSEAEIRNEFNIVTDKVVGMTASFSDRKDYQSFVIAAQTILLRRKDVTFIAIGEGPRLSLIKDMIKEENYKFFRFLGRQKDVESIVNIFSVGVLSTLTEGISNSIMEYMALSKPVVATDAGGNNELVVNQETGYLINNRQQLAEKISFLLDAPSESQRMGEKGRERIKEHFSITKMVNETMELYRDQIK